MRQTERIALVNGRVHTPMGIMDSLTFEAGCITSVGKTSASREGTRVIDLQGRAVLPGFCDTSARLVQWACEQEGISLGGGGLPDGEISRLLTAHAPQAAALGLTEISSDDLGAFGHDFHRAWNFFMAAELPFRLRPMLRLSSRGALMEVLSKGWRSGDGGPFCRMGPVVLDSSVETDELMELVRDAHLAGMQLALDLPLETAFPLMELCQEHRQMTSRHLLMNLPMDGEGLDRMRALRLGGVARGEGCRAAMRKGIVVSAGSQWPLESPLAEMQRMAAGGPSSLSIAEALEAYTWNGAWNGRNERRRGEIAPGRDADLVVLERDPFSIQPEALTDLSAPRRGWLNKVALTVCAGCVTYDSGELN
ncbi:MAG: amidohydrolase family protein [Fretibacterium sp.]|nr:amidohydrolase family protein [Fretibacterium sp.]